MHYGLTEASRSTFLDFQDINHIDSVGKPLADVQIKIVDDNFNPTKPNDIVDTDRS